MQTQTESARNRRAKSKTPRPFQAHLSRFTQALASLEVMLPAAKIQAMAAAFYGYRTGNALADAVKTGEIAIPAARASHGQESLVTLIDPETRKPFGVVPEAIEGQAGEIVATPYGTLVAIPDLELRHIETMAIARLRRTRAAVNAYSDRTVDWQQPEAVIRDLIADLIRIRHDLSIEGEIAEDQDPDEVAGKSFRNYQRECLGEIAHANQPDIRVEIDALAWDFTWSRDVEHCQGAMEAYSPGSLEDEPECIVEDMICDLMHLVATVDHGSPVEVLQAALRDLAPTAKEAEPRVYIQISVGR